MAGILDSVNQLTELVGQNRLELLLFSLPGRSQRFGINVFKVREVLQCPRLTVMPKIHRYVRGVAHIRGQTVSVIDLSMAIGGRAVDNLDNSFVIIAEYNRSVQGFLVEGVEKIINMDWSKILPPPQGMGKINYLTAVTQVDDKLVEIHGTGQVGTDRRTAAHSRYGRAAGTDGGLQACRHQQWRHPQRHRLSGDSPLLQPRGAQHQGRLRLRRDPPPHGPHRADQRVRHHLPR